MQLAIKKHVLLVQIYVQFYLVLYRAFILSRKPRDNKRRLMNFQSY